MRADLRRLPQGTFSGEACLDDDGIGPEPVRIRVRLTLDGHKAAFDFTGSDPQRAAPMNCNLTQTFTACVYVLKCLVDADIPLNEGFYSAVEVVAPEHSVVNASHPVAIVGGWEVCMRICEALFHALAAGMPNRVPAGTKGMVCQVGFGGRDPRTGTYYCFYETLAGGYGGRHRSDGPDAVQTHIQNTQNAPVEEIESNYPVRILSYSLIPDSEGAGERRGGLGLRREYAFVNHEPMFTILADRARFPPHGLFGGDDGTCATYAVISATGTTALPSKGTLQVRSDAVVRIETCGGGGYGPPGRRNPELVLRDVRDGKVSQTRAREVYGVDIDPDTWSVREHQTVTLRAALVRREV